MLIMKPDHVTRLPPKKPPLTPAERARRYRWRRKLKLLGVSPNLLEQALNTPTRFIVPKELKNGGNESCSKVEPHLSDVIHQANFSQDSEDYIEECSTIKENDQELNSSLIDIDNSTFCKQEDEGHLNTRDMSIHIKLEPGLSDYISQDDVSHDNTNKDSLPGHSYSKEEHSSVMKFRSTVEEFSDNVKTTQTRAQSMENNQTNMRDQQKQTNEIPIREKWMIKWNGDQPIAEPVLNEVRSRRPMTAAERKKKSREKKHMEAKYFHHKQEKCSCGTYVKTRDKLKEEVDALTRRKELLSAQISLLQAQPQQLNLGLAENNSEDDSSNVSTNDSSGECSQLKDVSINAQTKTKSASSVYKEINNDTVLRKAFFGMSGMLDDFQLFGEFVARELRNIRCDANRRRLKRMIQKDIVEVLESED